MSLRLLECRLACTTPCLFLVTSDANAEGKINAKRVGLVTSTNSMEFTPRLDTRKMRNVMKILCSRRSSVTICSPRTLELSCTALAFPPGSTFQERFRSSCRSLSAVLYPLTRPLGDVRAATAVRPRAESHQPPPHSPAWRGDHWSFSTLNTPSALQRPGPPRAAASGHPRHRMATNLPQLLPQRPQPPSPLDLLFLQKPCTLPQCKEQRPTVL